MGEGIERPGTTALSKVLDSLNIAARVRRARANHYSMRRLGTIDSSQERHIIDNALVNIFARMSPQEKVRLDGPAFRDSVRFTGIVARLAQERSERNRRRTNVALGLTLAAAILGVVANKEKVSNAIRDTASGAMEQIKKASPTMHTLKQRD